MSVHYQNYEYTRLDDSSGIDFLLAQRYASAGTIAVSVGVCLWLSVCRKSVFYRNGWTNRGDFGMGASFDQSYTVF